MDGGSDLSRNMNDLETYHRDDRWWRIAVSESARLLVRRGIEIVLGLLHGIWLMQRLLRLLLVLLLQTANTTLRTAETSWCAIRCADLPCDLPVTLQQTLSQLNFFFLVVRIVRNSTISKGRFKRNFRINGNKITFE